MNELNRFLRHGFAPLVTYLVAEGHLPEYAQGDVTEVAVIAASFAVAFVASKVKERSK